MATSPSRSEQHSALSSSSSSKKSKGTTSGLAKEERRKQKELRAFAELLQEAEEIGAAKDRESRLAKEESKRLQQMWMTLPVSQCFDSLLGFDEAPLDVLPHEEDTPPHESREEGSKKAKEQDNGTVAKR